jgi:hypothetical protein
MTLRGWRRTPIDPDKHRAARSHPLSGLSVISAFSGSRTWVDRTAEAAEGTLMTLRGWRRTPMDPDKHRAASSHPLSGLRMISAFSGSRGRIEPLRPLKGR